MKDYNVIWIDDEWEDQSEFREECEELNIHLKPFSNQKTGMDELDNHPDSWDAVILDGEIKDKSDNEVPSTKGLLNAIKRLSEMPANKRVPYFISTGKDKVKENEMLEDETIYKKGDDDDRLIDDIRNTIDNIERYKVKILYKDVIDQLNKISSYASKVILDIFVSMHYPDSHSVFDPILYYNQLRQILEYNFRAANKVGIVPVACFDKKGNPNLSQCCHYLSGNNATEAKVRYREWRSKDDYDRVVPKHIELMMRMILDIGNINSHSVKLEDSEEEELNRYINDNVFNSRYLIYSLALNACEITVWFMKYINNHQDREKNLKMCTKLDSLKEKETERLSLDNEKEETKRYFGKISKERNKVYSDDLGMSVIIERNNGFIENCSPQEYDYVENEKVYFELMETVNPKTQKPFSFAINIVPARKVTHNE